MKYLNLKSKYSIIIISSVKQSSLFRYRNIYRKRFRNPKDIKGAQENSQGLPGQSSTAYVLRSIRNEPEKIWTSRELYEIYISKGATDTSRVHFLYTLEEKLGKNYCVLKASGLAAICIHKEMATSIFKVTSVTHDTDEEMMIKVAKMIKADIAKKNHNVSPYSSLKKGTLNENSRDSFFLAFPDLHKVKR